MGFDKMENIPVNIGLEEFEAFKASCGGTGHVIGTAVTSLYTHPALEMTVLVSTRINNSPYASVITKESSKMKLFLIDRGVRDKRTSQFYTTRASKAYEKLKMLDPITNFDHSASTATSAHTSRVKKDENQVVETPDHFKQMIYEAYNIDHDPCPVKPQFDAMVADWGKRNFVNPPFGEAAGFFHRAIELYKTKGAYSVILSPVPFALKWFSNILLSGCISHITLLRGGMAFKGYKDGCPLPLCLIHIGPGGVKGGEGRYDMPVSLFDSKKEQSRRQKQSSEIHKHLLVI